MDNLFDFTGQVAIVTGGSRGMGKEMALALAARGADVVVTSRKAEACEAVAAEIEAMGRTALAYGCHVAKRDGTPASPIALRMPVLSRNRNHCLR